MLAWELPFSGQCDRQSINMGPTGFSPLAALAALDLFRLCGLLVRALFETLRRRRPCRVVLEARVLPPPRAAISIPFQIPALGPHAMLFLSGFIFFKHPPCSLLSSVYASFFWYLSYSFRFLMRFSRALAGANS